MINAALLKLLACPKCKEPVVQNGDWLVCQGTLCGLRYPIRNGIPVMLIEEAQSPSQTER